MYLIVWLLNNRRFYLERKGYSSSPRINYSKSCNSAENRSVRFLRRWATIIIRALDANCRIYYGTGRVCIWEEDLAFRGRIHPVDYASSVSCCPFSFDFWISRHCCPARMPPPALFRVAIRKEIRYRRFVNVKCWPRLWNRFRFFTERICNFSYQCLKIGYLFEPFLKRNEMFRRLRILLQLWILLKVCNFVN